MKVVIHDRTEGLPPSLRAYAERKLARLSRHFDKVAGVELHFEEERKRSQERVLVSRVLVHLDGRNAPVLKAEERASEMQAALDLCLDKIDRQVVKLKERVKTRKTDGAALEGEAEPAGARDRGEVEHLHVHLRPEPLEHARESLDSNGHVFHVFLNEDSGDVNVIYRRADGGVAVIEPVLR